MNSHQKLTIDQFTRQAEPFSKSAGHTNEESMRLLLEMAEACSDDAVLDVACGTGMAACAFAAKTRQVTGIDLTPAMLEQAKLLASQLGLTNLTWRQGDIETLPFPDNHFSIVLSRYAFHHFPDPGRVLREMARVCRPGGRVMVVDGIPPKEKLDAYNHFEKLFDPSHYRALPLEEFLKLFEDAGLQNIRTANYGMEMELERQLAASFPNPGDEEKLRRLFKDDVGIDRLGVGAHLRNGEIHYAYPVAAILGEKPASSI